MMEEKFLTYKNSSVFYRIYGKGKTVVLLHGFAEDGNIWKHTVQKLKQNFKVIVPDIPGSGKSELIKEQINISVDDYADVVMQILKKESVTKCCIIGHSMGGYIALAFAEKYAERLNSFGLFHSSAFADSEERKQSRSKSIKFLQKNDIASFLKTSIPDLFSDQYKQKHFEEVTKLIDSGKSFSNKALIQYQTAMLNRPDRINILKNSASPVLFITGEKDKIIPLENILLQSHLPAISYLHILKNSAHMSMLEQYNLSAKFIVSFLADTNN